MQRFQKNLYNATNSQGQEEDEELFSAGIDKFYHEIFETKIMITSIINLSSDKNSNFNNSY